MLGLFVCFWIVFTYGFTTMDVIESSEPSRRQVEPRRETPGMQRFVTWVL